MGVMTCKGVKLSWIVYKIGSQLVKSKQASTVIYSRIANSSITSHLLRLVTKFLSDTIIGRSNGMWKVHLFCVHIGQSYTFKCST